MLDAVQVRVELARRGLPQWQLARRLGLPPSTLSDYLLGRRPSPPDLPLRIERALGLASGAVGEGLT
jgi:DNA-binding transcriptional regulator YdaS (Cro superfamily)